MRPAPDGVRMCLRALLAGFVLVVLLPAALAFASVPTDSPHATITTRAAGWADWPEGGVDALVVAVHNPDYEQIDWEPHLDEPARYDLAPTYDAAQHCDRVPPQDDDAAFAAARALIQERWSAARAAADAETLVRGLGQALHAVQDCFSHSDFVDLDAEAQAAFVAFLLENGTAPAVRLVATAADIDDPGMPDDPYPHDRYAKDAADFNDEAAATIDGRTKFAHAQDAATQASARVLNGTLAGMSPEMRAAIDALEPAAPEASPIPAVPILAVLGALGSVLYVGRRGKGRAPAG